MDLAILANLNADKDAGATTGTLTKSLSPFTDSTSIYGVPLIKTGIRLTFWYSVVAISVRLNASSVACSKPKDANRGG